ncbi:hypothetical protein RHMOL_Rhmol07G0005300 [Rhododendron molle]|uniref:Uncharacterized protein n=1 Tax=Rhododendron molle TaxID=49168 RepID=A0ACC0MVK0_RHOML|nr:hypothetical protein RHMOL_Rhmol07G0005300 [Rhododendron molle]
MLSRMVRKRWMKKRWPSLKSFGSSSNLARVVVPHKLRRSMVTICHTHLEGISMAKKPSLRKVMVYNVMSVEGMVMFRRSAPIGRKERFIDK